MSERSQEPVVRHRLQLSPQQLSGGDEEGSEGGCEGGACQYRFVFVFAFVAVRGVLVNTGLDLYLYLWLSLSVQAYIWREFSFSWLNFQYPPPVW